MGGYSQSHSPVVYDSVNQLLTDRPLLSIEVWQSADSGHRRLKSLATFSRNHARQYREGFLMLVGENQRFSQADARLVGQGFLAVLAEKGQGLPADLDAFLILC